MSRFESFKLGAKYWLQSLNQCLSPHPDLACWSMMLQNPDMTGHTYIQETTCQIRHDSPLCKSECPRLPVWSMLLKCHEILIWGILPSFFPGCVQCWSDSCTVLEDSRSKRQQEYALLSGCRIVSGSSQSHEARGPDEFCASKLFRLLVPHILPFFRLAAVIFFLL